MTKKQTELSEELREAVFEAARAGAAEAYTQNTEIGRASWRERV